MSFRSAVYKIMLMDHRTVYIKIPYSKVKLEREYTVLERLRDEFSVHESFFRRTEETFRSYNQCY